VVVVVTQKPLPPVPPTVAASATLLPSDTPLPPTATLAPSDTPLPPTATEAAACGPDALAHLRNGSGFKVLYEEHAEVRGRLGCPSGDEIPLAAVDQFFGNGVMYWSGLQRDVFYVLLGNSAGAYRRFTAQRVGDLPDPPAEISPLMRREGGFARIYYGVTEVRDTIGDPLSGERNLTGALQTFDNGLMLYSLPSERYPRGTIYVLNSGGSFWLYADENPAI
jgi:hypothetical protein